MIKKYKLPIMGKVLNDAPLTGDKSNPIKVFPIEDLEGRPTQKIVVLDEVTHEEVERDALADYSFTCLDYNIEEEWCEVELEASEEFHNWLTGILPQLRGIKKEKGWKLDKAKMKRVK
ncbi:hypothetical protein ES705_22366 [subsurface metagenome]